MKTGDIVRVTTEDYEHALPPGTMGVVIARCHEMSTLFLVRMFTGSTNRFDAGWRLSDRDVEVLSHESR